MLDDGGTHTRWNKHVHIKINILRWRVLLDRNPIRVNLFSRCADLHVTYCMCCNAQNECEVAIQLWNKVLKWLDLPFPLFLVVKNLLDLLDTRSMSQWNVLVFDRFKLPKNVIYDTIVINGFNWFSNMSNKIKVDPSVWVQNLIFSVP